MSADWLKLTKVPEAGKKIVRATSSTANTGASPAASTDPMKTSPPTSMNRRRREPDPLITPTGSSRMLPAMSGTAESRPTCR